MRVIRHRLPTAPRGVQTGLAAIEFALVIVPLLVMMVAILGYGALFWMQQNLSHYAGEGARAAMYARQSPLGYTADLAQVGCRDARAWSADVTCSSTVNACRASFGTGAQCVTVQLSYSVDQWAPGAMLRGIANMMPFVDVNAWVPAQLAADASVQIR